MAEELLVGGEARRRRRRRPVPDLVTLLLGLGYLRVAPWKLDRELPAPKLDSVNGDLLLVFPSGSFLFRG